MIDYFNLTLSEIFSMTIGWPVHKPNLPCQVLISMVITLLIVAVYGLVQANTYNISEETYCEWESIEKEYRAKLDKFERAKKVMALRAKKVQDDTVTIIPVVQKTEESEEKSVTSPPIAVSGPMVIYRAWSLSRFAKCALLCLTLGASVGLCMKQSGEGYSYLYFFKSDIQVVVAKAVGPDPEVGEVMRYAHYHPQMLSNERVIVRRDRQAGGYTVALAPGTGSFPRTILIDDSMTLIRDKRFVGVGPERLNADVVHVDEGVVLSEESGGPDDSDPGAKKKAMMPGYMVFFKRKFWDRVYGHLGKYPSVGEVIKLVRKYPRTLGSSTMSVSYGTMVGVTGYVLKTDPDGLHPYDYLLGDMVRLDNSSTFTWIYVDGDNSGGVTMMSDDLTIEETEEDVEDTKPPYITKNTKDG